MDGIGGIAPPGERRDYTRPPAAPAAAAFGGVQMLGVAARGRLGSREQALETSVLSARVRELLTQALDFAAQVDDLAAGRCEVTLRFRRCLDGSQPLLKQRRQSVALLLDRTQAPQLSRHGISAFRCCRPVGHRGPGGISGARFSGV